MTTKEVTSKLPVRIVSLPQYDQSDISGRIKAKILFINTNQWCNPHR